MRRGPGEGWDPIYISYHTCVENNSYVAGGCLILPATVISQTENMLALLRWVGLFSLLPDQYKAEKK